jgi:uncharacterized protein with FMN-binding domain
MLTTYEKHPQRKLAATILAIVVVAGSVVFVDYVKAKSATAHVATAQISTPAVATTSPPATTPTGTPTPTTAAANTSGYKDGTYTASSQYYVPHGSESIKVNLTLSNGVITGASIQNSESNRDSALYQQDFASTYKSYVVGKKISNLQLDNVAGASDTTQGFDNALAQIAARAQA